MSTVVMPCRAAVIGPMVVPQGIELLETKDWNGTPAFSQAAANTAAARAVGGVALVDVDLEDRAAVGARVVRRVVPLGVVGVHGVAGVGGEADGAGERPRLVLVRCRRGRSTERSSTLPSSGPSAPVSDSLPFSSWSKAASTGMYGERRRRRGAAAASAARAGVHGQQVVQPRAGEQLLVAAQVGGRLRRRASSGPSRRPRPASTPGLLGDERDQVAVARRRPRPQTGCRWRCLSSFRPRR